MENKFNKIDPRKLQVGYSKYKFANGTKCYCPAIGGIVWKKLKYRRAEEAMAKSKVFHASILKGYDAAKAKWDTEHQTVSLVGLTPLERDMRLAKMMK